MGPSGHLLSSHCVLGLPCRRIDVRLLEELVEDLGQRGVGVHVELDVLRGEDNKKWSELMLDLLSADHAGSCPKNGNSGDTLHGTHLDPPPTPHFRHQRRSTPPPPAPSAW